MLTDIVLAEETDGVELARRARGVREALPVVYMTGYNRDLAPPVPGSDWLWKPFTLKELTTCLERALERRAAG